MKRDDLVCFSNQLLALDNSIILGHENPDPDSLGSMVALYLGLRSLGRNVTMVSDDPIPYDFGWPVLQEIRPVGKDTHQGPVIVLDCHPSRVGSAERLVKNATYIVNVDHHLGNPGDSNLTYIDTNEPATATMVYQILQALKITLDREMASALYAGLVGDTGGFRHSNTTPEALALGSTLVAAGAQPDVTARAIFEDKSWAFMSLLGHALQQMQKNLSGSVVWMVIDHASFERFRVNPQEADQYIQYTRMIAGVRIAILFRETEPGHVRIGFRSPSLDVGALARKFGGGGHRLASGARVDGSLSECVEQVIAAAEALVEGS